MSAVCLCIVSIFEPRFPTSKVLMVENTLGKAAAPLGDGDGDGDGGGDGDGDRKAHCATEQPPAAPAVSTRSATVRRTLIVSLSHLHTQDFRAVSCHCKKRCSSPFFRYCINLRFVRRASQ